MTNLQTKKEPVLGFDVDLLSFDEALQHVHQYLRENKGLHIVTINPEMIIQGNKNDKFGRVLNNAGLTVSDGVGIKIALKIKGINQETIPGVEFAKKIAAICALDGYSVGLFGAKEEIVQKAAKNLREEYANLNITYVRNGYFTESDEKIIKEEIKAISPKVLLVALGSPKQEMMISELKEVMPNTIFIGVGGSFDVWSGVVQRAPEIYQKLGLEWLYRTIKEPSRFKRIFPTLPLFLIQVIMETINEKVRGV